MLSVAGFAALRYYKVPLKLVTQTYVGMITAGILWSILIAVAMYVLANHQKTGLAPSGNTGKGQPSFCAWSGMQIISHNTSLESTELYISNYCKKVTWYPFVLSIYRQCGI